MPGRLGEQAAQLHQLPFLVEPEEQVLDQAGPPRFVGLEDVQPERDIQDGGVRLSHRTRSRNRAARRPCRPGCARPEPAGSARSASTRSARPPRTPARAGRAGTPGPFRGRAGSRGSSESRREDSCACRRRERRSGPGTPDRRAPPSGRPSDTAAGRRAAGDAGRSPSSRRPGRQSRREAPAALAPRTATTKSSTSCRVSPSRHPLGPQERKSDFNRAGNAAGLLLLHDPEEERHAPWCRIEASRTFRRELGRIDGVGPRTRGSGPFRPSGGTHAARRCASGRPGCRLPASRRDAPCQPAPPGLRDSPERGRRPRAREERPAPDARGHAMFSLPDGARGRTWAQVDSPP